MASQQIEFDAEEFLIGIFPVELSSRFGKSFPLKLKFSLSALTRSNLLTTMYQVLFIRTFICLVHSPD